MKALLLKYANIDIKDDVSSTKTSEVSVADVCPCGVCVTKESDK